VRSMRNLSARAVGPGFVRGLAAVVVGAAGPVAWAPFVLVAYWWRDNPWSWISLGLAGCAATLALARPVADLTRFLVRRWTGTALPVGRRPAPEIVRMASGHWWNGHSYERTRKDAEQDLRRRQWLRDPATWRDVRWIAIAPALVGFT